MQQKVILKHTEGTGAATTARLAVPNKVSVSQRSSLWYAGMSSEVLVLIGDKWSIYAAFNGAFSEFCIICGARSVSIGVVVERGSILLTSSKSILVET